ncbi:MAG: InlB B-repeat-containing protein [Oscillospiraceae bacterium]|nr:InlB B-repeat-containing protein [Oscillospiraceae bacterium]
MNTIIKKLTAAASSAVIAVCSVGFNYSFGADTEEKTYKVHFELGDDVTIVPDDDGNVPDIKDREGTFDSTLIIPTAELQREGYYFKGWYLSESDDAAVNYLTPYSGANLYAKWDETPTPVYSMDTNGHRYDLFDYHMTWHEAKAFCEEMGGHLVTITDASEQAAVESLVQHGSYCTYFIGCTDEEEDGVWKWVTGEEFDYSNWDQDAYEPNGGEAEYYGQMLAVNYLANKQIGEWNDTDDSVHWFYGYLNGGFVCEYDNVTVTYIGAYSATVELPYGSDAELPVLDVEGVHYTFTVNGEPWDGTNVTENVTVEVGMEIDVYSVVFVDGVTSDILSTQQIEYGEPALAPAAPAHYGYTFTG